MRLNRRLEWTVALACALATWGCGGGGDGQSGPTGSILVSVTPGQVTIVQGNSEAVTLAVARAGGFTGVVNLEVTGLPAGVRVTLSTIQLAGGATAASVSLAVAGTVPASTYTASVRASATGLTDATATFTVVVVSAYAISVSPAPFTVTAGTTQNTTIQLVRASGYTGTVTLSLDNSAGVIGTFAPASTSGTTASLAIAVVATAPVGSVTLTVRGSAAGFADRTATLGLTIAPVPDFTLTVAPAGTVRQGGSTIVPVAIGRTNFTGPVTLSVDVVPGSLSASFSPNPATGTTSSLTLAALPGAALATHPLVVRGRGDPGDRTTALSVTVAPPVNVAMSRAPASVGPGLSDTFAASVTGSTNTTVMWSVQEGAVGGSIDASGRYTAPSAVAGGRGTFHVIATSQADPSKSALAAVEVVAPAYNSWTALPLMVVGRLAHTATVLANGKVLIAGGALGGVNSPATTSAEIFDPATGQFTPTGPMANARAFHTAVLLPNGKVLVSGGGLNSFAPQGMTSQELYDPATGTFSITGSMVAARAYHVAVLLGNGKVLLAGWAGSSAELYDPAIGTSAATGSMGQVRAYSGTAGALLTNGKVLVVGGQDYSAPAPNLTAEVYDPATGTFSAVGAMRTNRTDILIQSLLDGRALIAGGINWTGDTGGATLSAELFNPATGQFAFAPDSAETYHQYGAIALRADGRVLVGGGLQGGDGFDVFDPATNSFDPAPPSPGFFFQFGQVTLLPGGALLVTGGGNASRSAFILR